MGKTKGSAVWDWGPAERCQVKAVYFKQQAGKGDPLAMFWVGKGQMEQIQILEMLPSESLDLGWREGYIRKQGSNEEENFLVLC